MGTKTDLLPQLHLVWPVEGRELGIHRALRERVGWQAMPKEDLLNEVGRREQTRCRGVVGRRSRACRVAERSGWVVGGQASC